MCVCVFVRACSCVGMCMWADQSIHSLCPNFNDTRNGNDITRAYKPPFTAPPVEN